jgi:hypothetical protein
MDENLKVGQWRNSRYRSERNTYYLIVHIEGGNWDSPNDRHNDLVDVIVFEPNHILAGDRVWFTQKLGSDVYNSLAKIVPGKVIMKQFVESDYRKIIKYIFIPK